MREIGDIVRKYAKRRGEPLALATLVRAWGSTYRCTGARMLIAADGSTAGSLSGGCLEDEVIAQAGKVLRTGEAMLMPFDTRRRFGCNGGLEILVERAGTEFLDALSAHYAARQTCMIRTSFRDGAGSAVVNVCEPPEGDEGVLWQTVEPPVQLIVLGEGPDNQALRQFAETLGWPVQMLESATELAPAYDRWTAAIVKTHNYGRDFAALRVLFGMDLPYIGLMGPRARREQLLGDLLDTGVVPGKNLRAPAGLHLGESAPEAIALSIVAEIQAVFAGGSGVPLRERKLPIHAPEPVAVAMMDVGAGARAA